MIMWEEENNGKKSKGQRLFSQGVVVLVCLILAGQAAFFAKYMIDRYRDTHSEGNGISCPVQVPSDSAGKVPPSGRQTGSPAGNRYPSGNSAHRDTPSSGSGGQGKSANGDGRHAPASGGISSTELPSGSQDTAAPDVHSATSAQYDGWRWDLVELNSADSAALDALPGIGPYYARQILAYRRRLGFYADISQLLDIRGFDTARLNRLADRIYIDPASIRPLDLYSMSLDSMAAHPYIGPYAAKGLDRLRRTVPREEFTIRTIIDSRILQPAMARRLALYFP